MRQTESVHPSKNDFLSQCLINVGPASQKVGQHESNIGSMSRAGRIANRATCMFDFMPIWATTKKEMNRALGHI